MTASMFHDVQAETQRASIPTSEAGLSKTSSALPKQVVIEASQPCLDPSCLQWLRQRLQLLCPAADSPLRGDAETPADFVTQLFDEEEHGAIFEAFLQEESARTLFAFVTTSRQLMISTMVPKPGDYTAMMYMLCPAKGSIVRWNMASLARKLQVWYCLSWSLNLFCGLCVLGDSVRIPWLVTELR